MGRWQWAVIVMMLVAAPAAMAQDRGLGDPRTGTSGQAHSDAAALLQEVDILLTVRDLSLTNDQVRAALALAQGVAEDRAEVQALRASVWEEHQDDIQRVNEAWLKGNEAPRRAKRVADEAISDLQQAEQDLAEARRDAAEEFVAGLTEDQRSMVEDPELAAERAARQARMGGIASVGEFIAAELDAIRDLMPDEYDMLAEAEARRIAQAIVGPDAPNLDAMTDAVLNIMDQVFSWTPERYQRQRQDLPRQIENALDIHSSSDRQVSWDAILALVGGEGSVTVLTALAEGRGGEEQ
ncbi:MAG: hypothetical protein U9R79_00385 [Armatimonadota bacterium]|nr:hypothetical protein [Armatimonadota bacterium]